jgi:Protein of unknown function (DUF4012)
MYGSPRFARLFLGFQNPAELRGTGGLIGQYGILQGSPSGPKLITVDSYDTLNRHAAGLTPRRGAAGLYPAKADGVPNIWSSVNLPPHLPQVGRDIVELYRHTVGPPLDAVVLIDPLAVARILEVSGALRSCRVPDHRDQRRQPHAGRGLHALRRRPGRPAAVPG